MPSFISVFAIDPPTAAVDGGDGDHTVETLWNQIEEQCADWSETVRVVYGIEWEEEPTVGALIVTDGEIAQELSVLSLDPDEVVAPGALPNAGFELTCDASDFADAIAEATPDEDPGADEGSCLGIPYRWQSSDKLLMLMRMIAPHIKAEEETTLVTIDGALARLTVNRSDGVTLEPVFYWFEDERVRQLANRSEFVLARQTGGPLEAAAAAVLSDSLLETNDPLGPKLVKLPKGKTPLTSGSQQARISKADDASVEDRLAALEAPDNQGPRFDELRGELYRSFVGEKWALKLLVRRLPVESIEARTTIYSLLTAIDADLAASTLADAFENDSPNASFIASVVWRQRGAVDLLVSRMARAWDSDPKLAGRILAMLRSEYISVHPAQLEGAPKALVAALGTLVKG